MRSNSCTVHSGGVGLGGEGVQASCTRADTGAGGRAEGRLSWATQNRTRLMLCDRQKPATPFNVAPIRALPVLASFLERRLCQTTGGRAAACQLPNMTFAGWAAEPQRGDICGAAFHPLGCRGYLCGPQAPPSRPRLRSSLPSLSWALPQPT